MLELVFRVKLRIVTLSPLPHLREDVQPTLRAPGPLLDETTVSKRGVLRFNGKAGSRENPTMAEATPFSVCMWHPAKHKHLEKPQCPSVATGSPRDVRTVFALPKRDAPLPRSSEYDAADRH